jgi:hypothetical protein
MRDGLRLMTMMDSKTVDVACMDFHGDAADHSRMMITLVQYSTFL